MEESNELVVEKAPKEKKKVKGEKHKSKSDKKAAAAAADDKTEKKELNGILKKSPTAELPQEEEKVSDSTPKPTVEPVNGATPDPKTAIQQLLADDGSTELAKVRQRSPSKVYEVPEATTKKNIEVMMDMDDSKLLELKEAFLLFDLDGDGCIDHRDLQGTLISLGQTVNDEEINQMLSEASNPLDFDAFVVLLGYKTIELDPEETLIEALSQWDYEGSGFVSEDRIRHDLMTWGDRFSKKEVDWALEEAPVVQKKHTFMIDYIKFCKILCGLRKARKAFNE